jgi:glycine/D-amino acid oxidase-like deaminating enzyme
MGTVIIGGGIIGMSIAYYLSEDHHEPSSIHIVDISPELFTSASGYAAGFLARDWFSSDVEELGALSFSLHQRLSRDHNGGNDWGYAPSKALSLTIKDGSGIDTGARGEDWLLSGTSRAEVSVGNDIVSVDGSPTWLTNPKGGSLRVISSDNGCAQVDPLRLCKFLARACQARGIQLHYPAQVDSLIQDEEGRIVGVRLASNTDNGRPGEISCKNIVVASGAWTPSVFKKLFPRSTVSIPVSPLAGYSLIIGSPRHSLLDEEQYQGGSHAIFSAPTNHYSWAPELFSRKGAEIYIAGLNDPHLPLIQPTTGPSIQEAPITELKKVAMQLLGRATPERDKLTEDDLEVLREGLCYRPVTQRGTPIITKISTNSLGKDTTPLPDGGVFVAAGHGPWGISLSLGTGKVVAELIRGEETSAEISALGL